MKKKSIIAIMMAAIIALGAIAVFAADDAEALDGYTGRFWVVDPYTTDDMFEMVTEDGTLTISITNDTAIYFEDYVPASEEEGNDAVTRNAREVLFGRTLAEVLNSRNMSITFVNGEAVEVIILFETAVHLPATIGEENEYIGIVPPIGEIDWDAFYPIMFNGEIVVENVILENVPSPFWDETYHAVMIPLRPVAEALGYTLTWEAVGQRIYLNNVASIAIGSNQAHFGRMAPIELSANPVLVDGVTFVPMDFFRNVLGQHAYAFEGQVVISAESDMM
ncbi:MAG: copper amine oxidase N-terminal domain-containing protein [Defluviitaleaceae bacterium]|nr:copper amine oxidase N-terminal domain-containing protein [Defluviitaleaceae bacterium]